VAHVVSAAGRSFWSGRSVLVTGGNGFIGGNLVAALVRHGANVVVLVRDIPPRGALQLFDLVDRVTVVFGSVTDDAVVSRALTHYGVTDCFHLAAQALVGTARVSPADTFDSNVRGTWIVLEACRCARVGRIVVASSDKAYGTSDRLPYVETHPLLATGPYDASKACTDIIARSYHASYGLPVSITRCANVYGPGDVNVTRLIPDVISSALRGEPVRLRSDGSHRRDFMFVDDAVDAYLTLAERTDRDGIAGQAFNIGTGEPRRVIDVVRQIVELAGRPDLEPIIEARVAAGEEIPSQYTDSTKAKRMLGWQARVQFEEGLRRTIQWHRDLPAA